jgi:hypothetical protein
MKNDIAERLRLTLVVLGSCSDLAVMVLNEGAVLLLVRSLPRYKGEPMVILIKLQQVLI